MKNNLGANIRKLLNYGDRVVVGFSGGADSAALLHILSGLKTQLNLNLIAAHLNHELRGEESLRDENFARSFAASLDIPFHCVRLNIKALAEASGKSIEETAREERYKMFESLAEGGKIATAHTLSDNTETMLFNLTRGTGIDGLVGIPKIRGNIIRPLLYVTRSEIEEYCTANNISYVTDSSNLKEDYSRNKIRLSVIPKLREINPEFEKNMHNTANLLESDSNCLYTIAIEEKQRIKTPCGYNIESFLKLHKAIASRIIIDILKQKNIPYSYDRVNLIYNEICLYKSGLQLTQEFFLFCESGSFFIEKPKAILPQPKFLARANLKDPFKQVDILVYGSKTLRIKALECKEIENIKNNCPNELKNLLDYDKIEKAIVFRQRKAGDSFNLSGSGQTKSLKKLFNEKKIPLEMRSRLVVAESGGKVVWLETFGASGDYAVSSSTEKAIDIKIL